MLPDRRLHNIINVSKIMKVIVTAGPTREALDPVRYISNGSTGKMGYALAFAAVERGHEVALISGPSPLEPPTQAKLIEVNTAAEMLKAVEDMVDWCDSLVMAAAVADWRPKVISEHKMKKDMNTPTIEIERTTDILKQIAPRKENRIFVGFAAESQDLRQEASRKLKEKDLDLIVANNITEPGVGFGSDTNRVLMLAKDGHEQELPLMAKKKVADTIIEWLEIKNER